MNFTLSENLTICLNMIVKNESHIIKNTLEMLCNKINFSYWVISDTGSTDNTTEIITQFFKDKNIPGELYIDKWENFAHNRTLALNYAYSKTDLLFIFDADDEIYGDILIPTNLNFDGYYLNFGSKDGISYQRVLIINNKLVWKFKSVIHEYIYCLNLNATFTTIEGNYYIVSGRNGNRNKDPKKYLNDANLLEEAYIVAKNNNDDIYLRYGFYIAQSYFDYGDYIKAIEWYKITLNNNNWYQEKYISCLKLFELYSLLNKIETGIYYLVEAFKYDKTRCECLLHLIKYYCNNEQNDIAYLYYYNFKKFYENEYLNQINIANNKLFVECDKFNFYLPYYMIIVSDKVKNLYSEVTHTICKMFEIIFIKKYNIFNEFFIGNLLYNLQFFIDICIINNSNFINLFQEYITHLENNNYNLFKHDFIQLYLKYNIKIKNIDLSLPKTKFTIEECKKSNKILFFTGFSNILWNYTYSLTNGLGGSETAVINLSQYFPSNYEIYIAGEVSEEKINNITYLNFQSLSNIINVVPFHTVIVSRYISFYELFPNTSFYQSFIWGHDINLHNYGCKLDVNFILKKWLPKINLCVCQTEWHIEQFKILYPELKNKLIHINNGISVEKFVYKTNKITNSFIYSSCSERGLDRLLELWPQIQTELYEPKLFICSYNKFPSNNYENQLNDIIKKYNNITHLGSLSQDKLYELLSSIEYWLYPTNWPETSCITSMEMLMSNVICLYYPIAGLVNTLQNYGIIISKENEINTILELSNKTKSQIIKRGKEYALSCSWENRSKIWLSYLFNNNINNNSINKRLLDLHEYYTIPNEHINFLKKLKFKEQFEPLIIYDIGANVLHWTREAKNIWPNSEFIVFDAIKSASFLYEQYNLKYHIGVLSDKDNKIVNFYENFEHPAGNSYYQEIGHPKSSEIFPDNSFTEQESMTLNTIVKTKQFPYPDLIKIDVQGAELDIIKGSLDIINKAKFLIVELQHIQYNKDAPLCHETISFLKNNGWNLYAEKFSDNGPDADYCFIKI